MSIEDRVAEGRDDDGRRHRARVVRNLERRARFRSHLVVYAVVSLLLVGVWSLGETTVFWPFFPMIGWGVVVATDAWCTARRG